MRTATRAKESSATSSQASSSSSSIGYVSAFRWSVRLSRIEATAPRYSTMTLSPVDIIGHRGFHSRRPL